MNNELLKGYGSAPARWARFGSYYAMFPSEFALEVVSKYSKEGDDILDPFAGRGTSIFAASVLGRFGTGIEINPVGFIFAQTKLNPANQYDLTKRLLEIYEISQSSWFDLNELHKFFRYCFCDDVLRFLLTAKNELDWIDDNIDRTLMGFILASLHDNIGDGLSNQMRRTKSMSKEYSIAWWIDKGFSEPPQINPYEMLIKKMQWRYKKGIFENPKSKIYFGDSTNVLDELNDNKYSLLLTSPPYQGVTNYHDDQWLRLWMLEKRYQLPTNILDRKHQGRFGNRTDYQNLINTVFQKSATLMKKDAIIYVRTDVREFTFETTKEALQLAFPNHKMTIINKPIVNGKKTQTELFGQKPIKSGEMDIILTC